MFDEEVPTLHFTFTHEIGYTYTIYGMLCIHYILNTFTYLIYKDIKFQKAYVVAQLAIYVGSYSIKGRFYVKLQKESLIEGWYYIFLV